MLPYRPELKSLARDLRSHQTEAEQKLWFHLRRQQLCGWAFYRQKPLGPFIVDFYGPVPGLVIELDGSQHFAPEHQDADRQRDARLAEMDLLVLRFDDRQVLLETGAVVEVIREAGLARVAGRRSLNPL